MEHFKQDLPSHRCVSVQMSRCLLPGSVLHCEEASTNLIFDFIIAFGWFWGSGAHTG